MTPTTTTVLRDLRVDRHHSDADVTAALADDVQRGLTAAPKWLPPKWFYDDAGSVLFDEITRLPDYYPTRREREVLHTYAAQIAAQTHARTLVELGAGSAEKTRLLLDALRAEGTLDSYVPVDVSDSALVDAASAVAEEYPGLKVRGVVADFVAHLGLLPTDGRRLIAFLGGTIGNFEPSPRADFLAHVAASLHHGDAFLLGTDLVKDPDRLVRAYDDSAGVTARFNRNVLAVVNRELGADFDLESFAHVAVWDAEQEWMEMRLRSLRAQTVHVKALDMEIDFAAGETMRTEISAKFTRTRVEREFAAAGLRLQSWWTDQAGDYAVSLGVPAAS